MSIILVINTLALITTLIWYDLASQAQRRQYRRRFAWGTFIGSATLMAGMALHI